MAWVTHPTSEMPPLPPPAGRHRRRRLGFVGLIAFLIVLFVAAAGAMIGPDLFGGNPATWNPGSTLAAPGASQTATRPPKTAPTSVAPTPSKTSKPKPPPAPAIMSAFEDSALKLINAARRDRGCRPLKVNDDLRQAARAHSIDMARYGYFSHEGHDGSDPADRISKAGYSLRDTAWAENIARGYTTPEAAVAGWLASKDHRANILNCSLRSTGIGVAKATNGQLYWTQDFGGR